MSSRALISAVVSSLVATPALAQATGSDAPNKVIWLALGVVFLGAFTAIFAGLSAALAARKAKADEEQPSS